MSKQDLPGDPPGSDPGAMDPRKKEKRPIFQKRNDKNFVVSHNADASNRPNKLGVVNILNKMLGENERSDSQGHFQAHWQRSHL